MQGYLRQFGITELSLSEAVKQICELSKKLAFTLSDFPQLEAVLSNDDTLIDALHKKVDSFMKQRMRIGE